ncbi:MAG: four helix bundle protein [Pirellulales bacterium]
MSRKTIGPLYERTKRFGLDIVQLVGGLRRSLQTDVIGKQLLCSALSVGANYRAACRGRSTAEFLAKLGIVEEEADESAYWLEILDEAKLIDPKHAVPLKDEAEQITAMIVASIRTARTKQNTATQTKREPK